MIMIIIIIIIWYARDEIEFLQIFMVKKISLTLHFKGTWAFNQGEPDDVSVIKIFFMIL